MASEQRFRISQLVGEKNWSTWKAAVQFLLDDSDALEVVTGELVQPDPPTNDTADDVVAAQGVLAERYKKSNRKAKLILASTMSDEVFRHIKDSGTARLMWQKLESIYEQSTDQRRERLFNELFGFKYNSKDGIMMHITRLTGLFNETDAEIKKKGNYGFPPDLLLSRIVGTLPSEYSGFKTAWESASTGDRTLAKLTERLCGMELDLQKNSGSEETVAFSAAGGVTKTKFLSQKKKPGAAHRVAQVKADVECYRCHKKGHYQSNCTAIKVDRGNQQKGGANRPAEHGTGLSASGISLKSVEENADFGDDLWYLDSCCSNHMTYSDSNFTSFEPFGDEKKHFVKFGNMQMLPALGKGNINVESRVGNKIHQNHLRDVWFVPGLDRNLVSVSTLTEKKEIEQYAVGNVCGVRFNGKEIITGQKVGRLYRLNLRTVAPAVSAEAYATAAAAPLQLWHERMGHQNKQHVCRFLRSRGIEVEVSDDEFCTGCIYGKQHRKSFKSRKNRATKVGELINSDVCGPMQVESLSGFKYYVNFKDDFSKFRRVYFIRQKSEVVDKLKLFLAEAKAAGQVIKELLTDGGTEYFNADVRKITDEMGICHRSTMPYTPQQNGASERDNRTIVESMRSMLKQGNNLPLNLWAEAVNTAVYVLNHTGPCPNEKQTPYELWNGKPASFDQLRIFGSECYVHVPSQKRKKLDSKSEKGIFVGYCNEKDGYRIYSPEKRNVYISCDVIFRENPIIAREYPIQSLQQETEEVVQLIPEEDEESPIVNSRVLRDRSKIGKPDRYSPWHGYVSYNNVALGQCYLAAPGVVNPESMEEAMESDEAVLWQEAMEEELSSLAENETWNLVDQPPQRKIIDNKWVLRKKLNPDGSVERYKARLVVKGYSQKPGIDFDETFSPVARFDTVRTLLSVAASENLQMSQFDVRTAFLYGELKEEIYMQQPEGFEDRTGRVCRLQKSLYGLKQAPRCWNTRFKDVLTKYGLQTSTADPCLFINEPGRQKLMVAIYVDDGLVVGEDQDLIDDFLLSLREEFKIVTGTGSVFLGMQIIRGKDRSLLIHQKAYAEKVLARFNMTAANEVATPMEPFGKSKEGELPLADHVPYRQAVGSLMYLAAATRPDLAFAVSTVSQRLEHPTQKDWQDVKRILKYLVGSTGTGIKYQAGYKKGILEAYADADYAGCPETRRSTSGVVCKYGGGAITWMSQKQRCVALSTTEAELMAACEGTKEVVWLKRLLGELTELQGIPVLHTDSASALKLAKNPEFHKRTKHIQVRHFYVRERFQEGALELEHIKGEDQVADIMTKPLPKVRFRKLRELLGLNQQKEDGKEDNL